MPQVWSGPIMVHSLDALPKTNKHLFLIQGKKGKQ